jgi:hypothetical protein
MREAIFGRPKEAYTRGLWRRGTWIFLTMNMQDTRMRKVSDVNTRAALEWLASTLLNPLAALYTFESLLPVLDGTSFD